MYEKIFSYLDIIKEMKYGLLALGVFTTIQTVGLVYYFYCNKTILQDEDLKESTSTEPETEDINEVLMEAVEDVPENTVLVGECVDESCTDVSEETLTKDTIQEQLQMLSAKKKELQDMCFKINALQEDIEKIREKLEVK